MSPRYTRHLRLPDKVIGWLDTAAVRTEMNRRWEVRKEDVVPDIRWWLKPPMAWKPCG
jgi:hypothetical protein